MLVLSFIQSHDDYGSILSSKFHCRFLRINEFDLFRMSLRRALILELTNRQMVCKMLRHQLCRLVDLDLLISCILLIQDPASKTE